MANYHFVSLWDLSTHPDEVWEYAGNPEKWELFWPGLHEVRLLDGPGQGAKGSRYEFVFKSFLPFTVSLEGLIVESDPPHRMTMDTTGELEGCGVLQVKSLQDGVTRSRFVWDTRTTPLWMNATAPLLRGLYEWNHDFLMAKAGKGMAEIIGARILRKEDTGASLPRALLPFAVVGAALWALRRSVTDRGGPPR